MDNTASPAPVNQEGSDKENNSIPDDELAPDHPWSPELNVVYANCYRNDIFAAVEAVAGEGANLIGPDDVGLSLRFIDTNPAGVSTLQT